MHSVTLPVIKLLAFVLTDTLETLILNAVSRDCQTAGSWASGRDFPYFAASLTLILPEL